MFWEILRKIWFFFKNLFMSFFNLFSKKTSSSLPLEAQIQQVNTISLNDTEEETQTTLEKIQGILTKATITLNENQRERLIKEAYNPESILDGIKELMLAKLLTGANLDIILSKTGKWDAARTIVALEKANLLEHLDLALETYPHFYRAQIIINLHHASLDINHINFEVFDSRNPKELSRPIMILSHNNLLTQTNLGSILKNQDVFLSKNISPLWERFCLNLSNKHPYSLSQEQLDKIISLCQEHRDDKSNSKMTGLEIFIRKNIFREKMTPQTTTHVSVFFIPPEEKHMTDGTISKRI